MELSISERPLTFDDIIGNTDKIMTLKQGITNNYFPKLTAFAGVAGIGKSTLAKVSALTLQCKHTLNGKPCLVCPTCKTIIDKLFMHDESCENIFRYNMAIQTGKADSEEIITMLSYKKPSKYNKTIFILEEPQNMSVEAQDALLGALEYVPDDTHIMLSTTDMYNLREGLLSRCTKIELRVPSLDETTLLLKNICEHRHIPYGKHLSALKLISDYNNNVPRDAIKDLEFVSNTGEVTVERVNKVLGLTSIDTYIDLFKTLDKDITEILDFMEDLESKNISYSYFLQGLTIFIKDAIKIKHGKSIPRFTVTQKSTCNKLFERYNSTDFIKIHRAISEIKLSNNESVSESELLSFALKLSRFNVKDYTISNDNETIKSTKKYVEKQESVNTQISKKLISDVADIVALTKGEAVIVELPDIDF